MYCEKCGTKNKDDSKFCEKCGHAIKVEKEKKKEIKKEEKGPSKLQSLPKKTKIIMGIVLIILVISIIVLWILLNNPVKKVEDSLSDYYTNYNKKDNQELIEIGKVLKSNKENEKVLKSIKETTHKQMEKWVKNFNTEYKNKEALEETYQKVSGALKDIYNYFNGLEYMLDKDLYNEFKEEVSTLYNSKYSYLNGKEYEDEKNEYYAYYNYQKVMEKDCYFKEAQQYINNFVKEEMASLKENAEKLIEIKETSTDEEILNCYIKELEYLDSHKVSNNIDLSNSEEYKKLYEEASKKVLEYTKKLVEEDDKKENYAGVIKTIEEVIKRFNNNSDAYKELDELRNKYKDKMPDKLIDKYRVSNTFGASTSSWSKKINGKEYDHYLRFNFTGENQSIVYRLNNEYKKLKTTIIRGEDWDKSFNGYFVITGDNKELYKSEMITKTVELKADIDIDVTGIDDLKIEFVTTSKASGWNDFYIYLVEPYLYK